MKPILQLAACLLSVSAIATAAQPARPHIVFIIADDLGWDDVGFHGSDISTPNIDALAFSGIILNKYYVSPICSPTRSAIMTGRHPIHTGMHVGVIGGATPYGLPLNETIMAQHLQTLGYRRHIVGKWHLGFFAEPYLPTNRGFESHFGYYTGKESYFDHEAYESNFWGLDIHRNGVTQWDLNGNFSTEMYTEEAENIIRNHNASEPLFLYLAHQAVHAGNGADPLQVPQAYVDRFKNIKDVGRRIFAGMVSALDDSVGRVVAALEYTGLMNNTIIVFTTDNGGPTNGYDGNAACNWPLRGVKNTMWEGGVRGVGIVNSPLLSMHYVSESFFHVTDWLPTLYRAAGGDPFNLKNLDGFDMYDMLRTNGPEVRKEVLHNIDPVNNFAAVRIGDFKLVMGHISKNDNGWYPPPEVSVSSEGKRGEKEDENGHWSNGNNVLKFITERNFVENIKQMGAQVERGNDHLDRSNDPNYLNQHLHTSYGKRSKGQPIVVNCGNKPLNTSFNCMPETSPCLFHIPSDPCEFNNVATLYPDKVQELLKRLDEYRTTMVPPQNKPEDPMGNPFLHGGDWKPWK